MIKEETGPDNKPGSANRISDYLFRIINCGELLLWLEDLLIPLQMHILIGTKRIMIL